MDSLTPILIVGFIFVGLPWVVLHYVTQWKRAATLTNEDEAMLDQMVETARRLEERLQTIERIIAADNPDFRPDFRPGRQPGSDGDYGYQRRD